MKDSREGKLRLPAYGDNLVSRQFCYGKSAAEKGVKGKLVVKKF